MGAIGQSSFSCFILSTYFYRFLFTEEKIKAYKYPPCPEEVKADMKALTHETMRKVVPEIVISKIQAGNCNDDGDDIKYT